MPRVALAPLVTSISSDGSSGYVEISNPQLFNNVGATSFACWVYVVAYNSSTVCFYANSQNTGGTGIGFGMSSVGRLTIQTGGGSATTLTSVILQRNQWYHLVFIYDPSLATGTAATGTRSTILINGVPQAKSSDSTTSVITSPGTYVRLMRNSASNQTLSGSQSGNVLFNRALTLTEAQDIYYKNVIPSDAFFNFSFNDSITSGSTTFDSTSNAFVGTLTGTVSRTTNAPFNNRFVSSLTRGTSSIDFAGVSGSYAQTVSNVDGTSLDPGLNSFSLMAWIMPRENGTSKAFIGTKADSGAGTPGYCFCYVTTGTKLLFQMGDGTNLASAGSGATITNITRNQWIHMAAVVDRSTNIQYLYVNGELIGSTSCASVGSVSVAAKFTVGANPSLTFFANALVENVRYFNRAITSTEIKQAYSRGIIPNDVVGSWGFNEGTGTTANSSGSNTTPLILASGATWSVNTPF